MSERAAHIEGAAHEVSGAGQTLTACAALLGASSLIKKPIFADELI
jgi:hypothetical protein